MSDFIKLCNLEELEENKGKKFTVNDIDIALVRKGNKVFAFNNLCPHQHRSILHDGFIEGENVICPAHGWEFKMCTGKMEDRKLIDVYEVKITGGEVFVKVTEKEVNWNF